jgi:hypothetical protein
MDDRNRAEHQRLISIADQARKEAAALVVSSGEAIARANGLIQRHRPPRSGAAGGVAGDDPHGWYRPRAQLVTALTADLEIGSIAIYTRGMPSEPDNEAERFARIEALMEEYRVKHEDLEAYVQSLRDRAGKAQATAREVVDTARAFQTTRTGHR